MVFAQNMQGTSPSDQPTKLTPMTNQQIIEKATAELRAQSGYHFCPEALAATVEAGLQDGDKIHVGSFAWVKLSGDQVIFTQRENKEGAEEKEVRRMERAALTQEMLDTLIKCKAKTAAIAAVSK
jgi:hypothetical protein